MEKLRAYATFEVVGEIFIGDKSIMQQHKIEEKKDPWAKIQLGITDGTSTIYVENSASRTATVKYKTTTKDGVEKEWEVKRPALSIDGKSLKITDSTDPVFTALKKETEDLKNLGFQYKKILKLNPQKDENGKIEHAADVAYIDNYDFVNALISNAEALKGKKVKVKGNVTFDEYNNNSKQVYTFTSIEEVHPDEGLEQDVPLQLEIPFVVDKDCVSEKDFNYDKLEKMQVMERLIPYNVYVQRYDKTLKDNKLWRETFMLDLSNLKFDEENRVYTEKVLEMYTKLYVPKIKAGVYQDGVAIIEYYSGKGKVTLDEMEKMMIAAGLVNEAALLKEKQAVIKGEKQTMLKFRRFRANGTLMTNPKITDTDHWIYEESDKKAPVEDKKGKGKGKGKEAASEVTPEFNFETGTVQETKVEEKTEAPQVKSEFTLDL